MTFVRGVIFRSTSSGSSVIVAGSMSAKTMVAPRFMAWSTEAQKVMLWQMISSPTPSPHPNIAVCNEAVPVLWPSAYFTPCHSAKSRSNSTVTSVPDMAPRRSTSSAAASSSSVMIGHSKISPGSVRTAGCSAQDCELLHGCYLPPGLARPLSLVVCSGCRRCRGAVGVGQPAPHVRQYRVDRADVSVATDRRVRPFVHERAAEPVGHERAKDGREVKLPLAGVQIAAPAFRGERLAVVVAHMHVQHH